MTSRDDLLKNNADEIVMDDIENTPEAINHNILKINDLTQGDKDQILAEFILSQRDRDDMNRANEIIIERARLSQPRNLVSKWGEPPRRRPGEQNYDEDPNLISGKGDVLREIEEDQDPKILKNSFLDLEDLLL